MLRDQFTPDSESIFAASRRFADRRSAGFPAGDGSPFLVRRRSLPPPHLPSDLAPIFWLRYQRRKHASLSLPIVRSTDVEPAVERTTGQRPDSGLRPLRERRKEAAPEAAINNNHADKCGHSAVQLTPNSCSPARLVSTRQKPFQAQTSQQNVGRNGKRIVTTV